jgi:hypothetical protein
MNGWFGEAPDSNGGSDEQQLRAVRHAPHEGRIPVFRCISSQGLLFEINQTLDSEGQLPALHLWFPIAVARLHSDMPMRFSFAKIHLSICRVSQGRNNIDEPAIGTDGALGCSAEN